MQQQINYRKGILCMLGCFLVWGFHPLYWSVLCGDIETFFLMACRVVWAAACCVVILKMQGKLPELRAVFRDKEVLKREIPASFFLFLDWIIFLWATQNGRVMECSLGYYIQPLVVFFFGAIIFREKVSWRHIVILAIVIVGIVLSVDGFGRVPAVTIALASCFSVYAALKKSLAIDSVVSTTAEILMMVPAALLFIVFFRMGGNGMASMTLTRQLLMIGAGLVTGVPMVFYSIGVRNLPLMAVGIGAYVSPTISIFCGMLMGERFTGEKLTSFLFIWAGIILYVLNTVYESRLPQQCTE